MLKISLIQSKIEQEAFCSRCKIDYNADFLAYKAMENDEPLAICQFQITEKGGFVHNLACLDDKENYEAIFLLGRAVLNYFDLCGINRAFCFDKTLSAKIANDIGFSADSNGRMIADLTTFFDNSQQNS